MYKDLKKIYDSTRLDFFTMAVTHLVDIGFRAAEKITDDDIETLEENGLMTKEFVQDLVRLSRELAQTCENPSELIQFCQAIELFDTKWYTGEDNE